MMLIVDFRNIAKHLLTIGVFLLFIPIAHGLSNEAPKTTQSWIVKTVRWGNPIYQTLTFDTDKTNIAGTLDGERLTGTLKNSAIELIVKDRDNAVYSYKGKLGAGIMSGIADMPDPNNSEARAEHDFSARQIPRRSTSTAMRHEFKPVDYSNSFNPDRFPVLTIWSGDTVHTTTLDSGGADENGKTRALFGNPQTGPFFIVGAEPGDTLAIKLDRLKLNRDYADSLDSIVGRALGANFASQATGLGKAVRWKLDRIHNIATLENSGDKLKKLSLPVRPMLGGLGVAPGNGMPPISTGDTGRFGGNMDWPDVVEGNTIFLNVQQPGALLYLGDAHALQGDGETSQYGLETSMDVEFTVHVIKNKSISSPRAESPTQLIALGQAGSLDDALKSASAGLIQWLQQDYGLSLSECGIILGSSVHYSVPNLAGRSVGVAARVDKSVFASIERNP